MRRAIDIKEGAPYSAKAIEDATRALLDLEVFSAVEIEPELPTRPRLRTWSPSRCTSSRIASGT